MKRIIITSEVDKNYFINVKTPVVLAEQAYSWDVSGENYSKVTDEKLLEYENLLQIKQKQKLTILHSELLPQLLLQML